MSSSWGVYSGYELFEHQAGARGSEEYLDYEKYQLRRATSRRRWPAASRWSRSSPGSTRSAGCTRRCSQLRTLNFHHVDNDALLAYCKFDPVTGDTVLVVVTLNPFGPEEGTTLAGHGRAGHGAYDRFWVRDEVTGEEYHWGQANYVRLDPEAVAHVLNMPSDPVESRLSLLAEGVSKA